MILSLLHYLHYFLCNVLNRIERSLENLIILFSKRIIKFFFKKQEQEIMIVRQKQVIERGWQHQDNARAGGVFVGILGFLLAGIFICMLHLFDKKISFTYILITSFFSTWVITYFLVYRKNAFGSYFERYDRLSKARKKFYNVLCLIFILLVFSLVLYSWQLL